MTLYEEQLAKCQAEFKNFRMVPFDQANWLIKLLSKIIWRGAAGVTFWNTIYVQPEYIGTDRGAALMAHEIVHVRDQHKWLLLFPLTYFLLLPVGPSMKAIWEWRAYREDLRWVHEHPEPDSVYQKYLEDYYCQWVAGTFCSPMYLWMWPFKSAMYKKAQAFMASL